MRVLLVNHPRAADFGGGDGVQIRQTATALARLGVTTAESCAAEPDPAGFDLAHVFNLRTTAATLHQMAHLKGFGTPVVLSPLYLNPAVGLWGSRAAAGAAADLPPPAELDRRLAALAARTVTVALPGGGTYTADAPNRPHPEYDRQQRAAVALADLLLVNSTLERHALAATLRPGRVPVAVAPVGIDPAAVRAADPAAFRRAHPVPAEFVLCVGRVEPPKNQLLLAVACRRAGLPLVLVGRPTHPDYLKAVRAYGPPELVVLPPLTPTEVMGAFAAARVHALPSWAETCGLVNLEAAAVGTPAVAGTVGYEVEYLGDGGYYADPGDADDIAAAVRQAWDDVPSAADRLSALRGRVLTRFTWAAAADATFRAYRLVLGR